MVPYLRAANVTWRGFDLTDVKRMDFRPSEQEIYRLRPGDVLLSEASGSPTGVGKPAVWHDEIPGCCFQNTLLRVRPRAEMSKYLYYHFLHDALVGRFAEGSKGVGINHLGAERLSAWPVRVAPISEQGRVVAAIEEQFTRLDAAVVGLKRVRANLKRYRATVLKAACEGRLVPTEAELARAQGREYEPADRLLARILEERRARWEAEQLAKMRAAGKVPKDDRWKARHEERVTSDLSEMPEPPVGWTWATVEQLAASEKNAITDGPFGSNLKTSHYTSAGPRVVRLQNIGDGMFVDASAHISQEHYERLAKHMVGPGDLVIAALGENLPRACVIPSFVGPAIVKADCVRVKVEARLASVEYLNVTLNAQPTRERTASIVHGVGRPRLNLGEIRSIVLPLPPLAEQQRIVAEVERRLSVVEKLEATVEANLRRAERTRQAILKRAFEGKLVPQDPNDEPASVLLERIRAERAAQDVNGMGRRRKRTAEPSLPLPLTYDGAGESCASGNGVDVGVRSVRQ